MQNPGVSRLPLVRTTVIPGTGANRPFFAYLPRLGVDDRVPSFGYTTMLSARASTHASTINATWTALAEGNSGSNGLSYAGATANLTNVQNASCVAPSQNLIASALGTTLLVDSADVDAPFTWYAADLIIIDSARDAGFLGFRALGRMAWPTRQLISPGPQTLIGDTTMLDPAQIGLAICAGGLLSQAGDGTTGLIAAYLTAAGVTLSPPPSSVPSHVGLALTMAARPSGGTPPLDYDAALWQLDLAFQCRIGAGAGPDDYIAWIPTPAFIGIGGGWPKISFLATLAGPGANVDGTLSYADAGAFLPIMSPAARVGNAVAWRVRGTHVTGPYAPAVDDRFDMALTMWKE